MSLNKGIRSASARRRPSSPASNSKRRPQYYSEQSCTPSSERKMRSLQSLQERLCFTLKRPRTRRHGGPSSLQKDGYGGLKAASFVPKSPLVESGLIQISHLQCEYYESPSPLSISSCFSQESVTTTTTASSGSSSTTTASSTISHVSASYSPISPFEYTSSEDGFSCDEVMSLVRCCSPEMVMHNVLDFMSPDISKELSTTVATGCPPSAPSAASIYEEHAATAANSRPSPWARLPCESKVSIMEQGNSDCPSSSGVEDDGEPYRIDLCDFEPDAKALVNTPPEDVSHHHQKSYGGGVLCLRLDYEEVLRAWKEREECLISREPIYYPSPYLDPLHIFGHSPFVSHRPFF